jgi:hypothetical protein
MSLITVYVRSSGARSLDRVEDAVAYRAELDSGYRVGSAAGESRHVIFGPRSPRGMEAESAIAGGVLRVLDP